MTRNYFILIDDDTDEVVDEWDVNDPMHLQLIGTGDVYTTNNGIMYLVEDVESGLSVEKDAIYKKLFSTQRSVEDESRRRKWEKINRRPPLHPHEYYMPVPIEPGT